MAAQPVHMESSLTGQVMPDMKTTVHIIKEIFHNKMIDSRLFCIDSAVHLIQSILIEVLEVKSQLMYKAAHKLHKVLPLLKDKNVS